jgi:DNA-binding Lrp family transcriptional regulator
VSLDPIDERIVALLVENARATYAVIGADVGLSAPAVKRRVDRLLRDGVVTGFTARLNPAAMGWTTEAYVELYCRGNTSPEEIFAVTAKHPQVASACTVSGEASAMVHVLAAGVRDFERTLERISAEPIVVRTKSIIVLSRPTGRQRPAGPRAGVSPASA